MTLTIKDSPERQIPGKQGVASQNSANKAGESPRSNPVCLEVNVTIRSLPTEAGGLTKPIREDVRTVIVFDNGAVLRCMESLPVGLTVILSNANARDVVCKVVGGQNLPSIKGYVEVQFMESVNDFWSIHQDPNPISAGAPPAAPFSLEDAPQEPLPPSIAFPTPAPTRAAASIEAQPTHLSEAVGGAPTFDDIEGLALEPTTASTRASRPERPARPASEIRATDASGYNHSEVAKSTSIGNWNSSDSEPPADKHSASQVSREQSPNAGSNSVSGNPRDFMSKGLMAYEKPAPTSGVLNGRKPLMVGAAVLALAGIGGVVFFMHRQTAPAPVAVTAAASQPPVDVPPAANNSSEAGVPTQDATTQPATQSQPAAQPVAVEAAHPASAVAAIPAVMSSPVTTDTKNDSRTVRRPEKSSVATKQPEPPPARRAAIPNLKMSSPSAPNQKLADLSGGAAPMTDISATEAMGGSTPAGLLTSAGRTSSPPIAPPSEPVPAPMVKTVRNPQLISSPRLVYPSGAKQAGVQGTVTVSASIDENGKVTSAKAISGPLLLREAAAQSVKQWKYSPGTTGGKPTPAQVTVNVEFKLN